MENFLCLLRSLLSAISIAKCFFIINCFADMAKMRIFAPISQYRAKYMELRQLK